MIEPADTYLPFGGMSSLLGQKASCMRSSISGSLCMAPGASLPFPAKVSVQKYGPPCSVAPAHSAKLSFFASSLAGTKSHPGHCCPWLMAGVDESALD